ncbi:hypothetical protein [Rhodococcus sp. 14-2470-1a]|uniref:hypothetical protein n=1 Tax=Rhodococcus sp. 14-2470-1a TaxID=2023150 RepID=UPI000B9AF1A3|nr:hypothetical protein [Rhodococcus sp. 14-2470-1a]OZF47585.1 hypothetical protein CH292_19380 [Rhodococcus sp. 14-2470-1a]
MARAIVTVDENNNLPASVKGKLDTHYVPVWQASTAYTAGQVVAANGVSITRNANGTSRPAYDATEQALWTPVVATPSIVSAAVTPKLDKTEAASMYALKTEIGSSEVWVPEVTSTALYSTSSKTGARKLLASAAGISNPRAINGFVGYEQGGARYFVPGDGSLAPMPEATNFAEIAGWGSSSMQGFRDALVVAVARAGGLAYYNGGVGGQSAANILARVGTRPALINAATIPATGSVDVTCSNMRSTAPIISIPGTLAGVAGTLAKNAVGNNTFTFTRTANGSETPVPAGTAFVPDAGPAHRASVTLLNVGKNDTAANGTAGYLTMADLIAETTRVYKYLSGLGKHVLLIGHYVNPNTAEVSDLRRDVLQLNAYYATYGARYVDLQAYVTGADIWTHTGVTPNSTDLAQQALGNLPPSLSSDGTHMTPAANTAFIENVVVPKLNALGWASIPATAPVAPTMPADFLYRLNADYLKATVADGGTVSSLTAQAGSAPITIDQKPASGTYPTLKHAGPNGHASLVFPNTDSWLSTTTDPGTAPVLIPEGAPRSVVVVFKIRDVAVNAGNYPKVLSPSLTPTPSSYQTLGVNLTGTVRQTSVANGGSSVNATGTENVLGKYTVAVLTTAADGTATILTPGAAETTATGHPLGAIVGRRWGAQYGSAPGVNGQLDGEIADESLFSRVLTQTERANTMAYMKTLYGIA